MSRNASANIYGGKKPGEVPIYTVSEAAHHLRLPRATVRSWAIGRQYPLQGGQGDFLPLIEIVDQAECLLSFMNLVELHVLASIRRAHGVKLPAVRKAIDFLRKRFSSAHPLLDRHMLTDGKDLFIEHYEQLVTISQEGQMVMSKIMLEYLDRVKRDSKGIPIRLFPFTREPYAASPELVVIDPKVRFGKPCVSQTRIPTSLILQRYQAGDSIKLLAEDYGRNVAEIEEAIRYESRIAS